MRGSTPGYDGYPSSYGDNNGFFTGGGMAGMFGYSGMSGAPDGYVGNATVTTNDPPPAGDLKIHSAPSSSAPQIGGADKGAIVEVVTEAGLPSGWAKVGTFGSARNPQVVGYAALAYLTPIAGQGQVAPTPSGPAPAPVPNVPGVTPIAPSAPGTSNALKYGAIALGAVVVGGIVWYFWD